MRKIALDRDQFDSRKDYEQRKRLDQEMVRALEADGEKLRQMTGQDHGPYFRICDCYFDPISGDRVQCEACELVAFAKQGGPPTDNEPRCECGHLFEICDAPACQGYDGEFDDAANPA